jgi:hypothetical protein
MMGMDTVMTTMMVMMMMIKKITMMRMTMKVKMTLMVKRRRTKQNNKMQIRDVTKFSVSLNTIK